MNSLSQMLRALEDFTSEPALLCLQISEEEKPKAILNLVYHYIAVILLTAYRQAGPGCYRLCLFSLYLYSVEAKPWRGTKAKEAHRPQGGQQRDSLR